MDDEFKASLLAAMEQMQRQISALTSGVDELRAAVQDLAGELATEEGESALTPVLEALGRIEDGITELVGRGEGPPQ